MFEGVGRSRDDEAGRRGAQSLVLMSLMGFVGACAGGALLVWQVADPVEEPLPIDVFDAGTYVAETPVQVELAPPPPPLRRTSAEEEPTDPEVQPEPDELTDPQPLRDEVKQTVAASTGGTADGDPNGDPNGRDGGKLNGSSDSQCEGADCGGGTGGPLTLHHTEVEILRRVAPEYPEVARALGLDRAACKAMVRIDTRGRPLSVEVRDCPEEFHAETEHALMRWKFRPAKVEGQPVAAQFLLKVQYKLR